MYQDDELGIVKLITNSPNKRQTYENMLNLKNKEDLEKNFHIITILYSQELVNDIVKVFGITKVLKSNIIKFELIPLYSKYCVEKMIEEELKVDEHLDFFCSVDCELIKINRENVGHYLDKFCISTDIYYFLILNNHNNKFLSSQDIFTSSHFLLFLIDNLNVEYFFENIPKYIIDKFCTQNINNIREIHESFKKKSCDKIFSILSFDYDVHIDSFKDIKKLLMEIKIKNYDLFFEVFFLEYMLEKDWKYCESFLIFEILTSPLKYLFDKYKDNENFKKLFLKSIQDKTFSMDVVNDQILNILEYIEKNFPYIDKKNIFQILYFKIAREFDKTYGRIDKRNTLVSNGIQLLIYFQNSCFEILKSKEYLLYSVVIRHMTYDELTLLNPEIIMFQNLINEIPFQVFREIVMNYNNLDLIKFIFEKENENGENKIPENEIFLRQKEKGMFNHLMFLNIFHSDFVIDYKKQFEDYNLKEIAEIIVRRRNIFDMNFILKIIENIPKIESLIIKEHTQELKKKLVKKRTIGDIYSDKIDETIICNICCIHKRNIVYNKCGHTLCNKCQHNIGKICPFCRQYSEIHKIIL